MTTIRDLYVLSIFLMLYIAEVQGRRWGRFIKYLRLCINSGCTSGEIALLVTTLVLVIFCSCVGACFKEKIRMILIKCCKCKNKDRNDNDQSTQGMTIVSISFVELYVYLKFPAFHLRSSKGSPIKLESTYEMIS